VRDIHTITNRPYGATEAEQSMKKLQSRAEVSARKAAVKAISYAATKAKRERAHDVEEHIFRKAERAAMWEFTV